MCFFFFFVLFKQASGTCSRLRCAVLFPLMFYFVSPSWSELMTKVEGLILPVIEVVDAVETIVLMPSDKGPLIA